MDLLSCTYPDESPQDGLDVCPGEDDVATSAAADASSPAAAAATTGLQHPSPECCLGAGCVPQLEACHLPAERLHGGKVPVRRVLLLAENQAAAS